MSDTPEHLAAILAEMRDFCSGWSEDVDVTVKVGRIYGWACRLKAAAERQEDRRRDEVLSLQRTIVKMQDAIARQADAVNAAAMREALESCLDFIIRIDRAFNPFMQSLLENAVAKAKAALAEPPRNCDVGTAEEQKERFKAFCEGRDCYKCPFYGNSDCPLEWAQMPFAPAEGGDHA